MTLHRTTTFVLIIAVVLLLAACDGIDLDATTRTEPTPNVWGETMEAEIEQLDRAREAR